MDSVLYTKKEWDNKYEVYFFNFGLNNGFYTVDDEFGLEHCDMIDFPTSFINLKNSNTKLTYGTANFYADCISFDHETPNIVKAHFKEMQELGLTSIGRLKIKSNYDLYEHYQNLQTVIEEGSSYCKPFSSDTAEVVYERLHLQISKSVGEPIKDLPFSKWYGHLATEVHLYATALKQTDMLSEFLFYYRVIERISKSNGKDWIESNIDKLRSFKFGKLISQKSPMTKPFNIYAQWRGFAVKRLNELLNNATIKRIADKFYNEDRCGIAHGNRIVEGSFTPAFSEVNKDLIVVKMLAKMAIMEKSNICFN